MSLLEKLETVSSQADSSCLWKGTFRDFLMKYEKDKLDNANIGVLAHQRLYNMVLASGVKRVEHFGKERTFYQFFEETLFGIEDSLDALMTYFHSAAQKTETSRRMLLMYGPPSSGKSDIVQHLKRGLEEYTQTSEGAIYALADSKMHENPFLLIPEKLRIDFETQYGLRIEGQLSPSTAYELRHKYHGKFMDYPIEQIYLNEAVRKGIGTWLPQDPKTVSTDTTRVFIEGQGIVRLSSIYSSVPNTDLHNLFPLEFSVSAVREDEKIKGIYNHGSLPMFRANMGGIWIDCTHRHRLMTLNKNGELEWKQLQEIDDNTPVVVKMGMRKFGKDKSLSDFQGKDIKLTPQIAEIVGGLVSEGSCTSSNFFYCNANQFMIDRFMGLVKDSLSIEPAVQKNQALVLFGSDEDAFKGVRLSAETSRWFEYNFNVGCGACDKKVPDNILGASELTQIAFLEGLCLGDGSIRFKKKKVARFSYSTCSETLAMDVQAMLLNLGVFTRISRYVDKNYPANTQYQVVSEGSEVYKIAQMLPVFSKHRKFEKVEQDHRPRYEYFGSLSGLIKEIRIHTKGTRDLIDRRYCISTENSRTPTRATLEKWREELDENVEWTDQDKKKLTLDKIDVILSSRCVKMISTEYVGVVHGVDLSCDSDTFSYVANGLISHNSSDQSELVGSIDFAKIQEFGDEADPRTYNFNGELNVANRGIMEFIEGLKADERFLRVLLTATQEKAIKAPRFGLIYCDTVIILHSVHPDELVPIKKNGAIKLVQINSLLGSCPYEIGEKPREFEKDLSKEDIQVLSVDERTRQPVWSNIKRVLCHKYEGDILQLQQKHGDVLVSPNHSVYNQDFRLFDAKEHDKNELLTISHVPQESVVDEVFLAKWCQDIHVEDHLVLKKTAKQATVRSGVVNNISADKVPAFLRILAAYIAEGHLLGPKDAPTGISISQQSLAWLQSLKTDFEILSDGVKPYLNNREEADDHTSRLEIHSISWAHIIEQLCGRYSHGKKVPDFVFNMSYDMKMLFLGALIEGDGSRKIRSSCFGQEMSEEYLKNYFSYTTVSRYLAAGFCFLCKMCGVSVSIHSRSKTSTGKTVYHITYVRYPRNQNTKTADRSDFNGYLYDIEVDTPHAHNFVCGVGCVVCHNTNEEEFKNFMAEKKYEAYHDRMVIVRVPYNLSVSNEVRIYEKLLSKSDAIKNMHIAPKTLLAAAMFAILTRLAPPPESGELTLVKKMKLYDKQHVRGHKIEQVPDMKRKQHKEGMTGVSPRFTIDQISASIANAHDEGREYITALDVLRQLNKGIEGRDSFAADKKRDFEALIEEARSEWDDLLRNDIQKAFFVSYEKEARNLCENYLDQIDASCAGTKPRDPITGDEIDLDEKLMDSVEQEIDITSSGKEDFRNEILRAVGAAARAKKQFDYTQHSQLREAIQKKLFEERKNVIRMTISTRNPDTDELKKINEVVARMVNQQGYSEAAANDLLKYATAHLFDK